MRGKLWQVRLCKRPGRPAAVFALLTLAAFLLQWTGGAYHSELGEDPDEPAHFVTALMVRDYLAAGAPWPPMRYAETYYEHYPKVALGHWPPGYYAVSAIWMLVFGASKGSLLALQAVLTGLCAALLFHLARRVASVPQALGVVACFLLVPTVVALSREVMSDLLVGLLVLVGVMLLTRGLESGERRYWMAFGLIAAAGLLTKGSGALLLVIAPVSILLSWRLDLFRKASFWAPMAFAIAVSAPWYWLSPGGMHERSLPEGAIESFHTLRTHANWAWRCIRGWTETIGPWMALFLAAGVMVRVVAPLLRRRRLQPVWATLASLLAGMLLLFEAVPPIRDGRHNVLILAALLLFSLEGIRWVLDRGVFQRVPASAKTWAGAMLLPLLLLASHRPLPPKQHEGFASVAAYLTANEHPDGAILVSSDAPGEGMLVAELALRDRRPGRRVLRGTKILSSYDWMGEHGQLLRSSPQEVRDLLASSGVHAVVFDEDPSWVPVHHRLLRQTLQAYPSEWRLAASFSRRRGQHYSTGSLRVYIREKLLPVHSAPRPLSQLTPRRR